MTQLMEQAFEKASGLPDEEQNAIASIILREIESEERWNALFAQQRSVDLLAQMADAALAEARAGRARSDNRN
jgi:hypothetical protein